ncbi:MAG: hypothetical protein S0880_18460 [Actinomycetota bacterium]|nr:hypothetical protein [Actinomycetota bacterium]
MDASVPTLSRLTRLRPAATTPGPRGRTAREPEDRAPTVAPSRTLLLGAAAAIVVGSFLPWVHTPLGSFSGMAGAGVWTLYAGVWLVGAAFTRRRLPAAVQMAAAGGLAVALAGWQLARLVDAVGFGTWWPGVGLAAVAGGGAVALVGAVRRWSAG